VPRALKRAARPAGLVGAAAARRMSTPTPIVLVWLALDWDFSGCAYLALNLCNIMGASDFDMCGRIWCLSLRHCRTFQIQIETPPRPNRAIGRHSDGNTPFVAGISQRRTRRLGSLLGRSKGCPEPHWIALPLQRSWDSELRRSTSYCAFILSYFPAQK
jgi:hypothetical protein